MNQLPDELITRIKRQNSHLNAMERSLSRALLHSYPLMLQVEPTNRCNAACPTCARNYYDKQANPPGDLPLDLIPYLEQAMVFAETVLFGGYGEPLMGKNFYALVEQARRMLCRIEVITNGRQVDEETARFFAETGVGRVTFSVDSGTDEGMKKARGITLTEILDRVALLLAPDKHQPLVSFNMTLHRRNLDELPALVEIAAKHRVNDLFVAHQKIYTRDQSDHSVLDDPDHARNVFDLAKQKAGEFGVNLLLPPLSGTVPCMQPFEMMMVDHSGRVQGCCSALFVGGEPKLSLGRIPDQKLLDLWNHRLMVSARQCALDGTSCPEPCMACGFRVTEKHAHLRLLD